MPDDWVILNKYCTNMTGYFALWQMIFWWQLLSCSLYSHISGHAVKLPAQTLNLWLLGCTEWAVWCGKHVKCKMWYYNVAITSSRIIRKQKWRVIFLCMKFKLTFIHLLFWSSPFEQSTVYLYTAHKGSKTHFAGNVTRTSRSSGALLRTSASTRSRKPGKSVQPPVRRMLA